MALKSARCANRTGRQGIWEPKESSQETDADEYTRAATAYVAWPLAFFELARRSGGSLWYRAHLRQAAVLGVLMTAGLFAVLAVPLVLVLVFVGMDSTATIRIYGVALLVDTVVFVWAATIIIRSMLRASRGEVFSFPVITELSERIFRAPRG